MANIRQYIGARYVFKIYENSQDPSSAEWEPNVTYEPLTIVTYLNSTYASKKDVPGSVGNPAANPQYWVITGAYNGQIAALQQQINTVNTTLQQQIDTINNTDLPSINSAIQTLTNRIDEIESNTKTEILLFGDSWADYTHDADNVRIPSVLTKHFAVTVHNYAYGGTGFDVTHGYDEQIELMAADGIDYTKVKCAILVCGLNDYQRTTTKEEFTAMLADWYDKLVAVIGNNIPVYWFNNYGIANDLSLTNPTTFYQQFSYYNHVRANVDRPIIMPLTFGWISTWNNDTHPNATGSTDFALNMCRAIEGIKPILFKYQSINLPLGTNGATIDYYFNGTGLLDCYWNADLADMMTITAARALAYSHTPPCRLVDGCYLNEGHSIAANDYINITMAVNNPSMLSDITYTEHGKLFVPIKAV